MKNFCLIFLSALFYIKGNAQQFKEPTACFTFNNHKDYEEISKTKIKLVNTTFTDDRFGNQNHAVYIYGNPSSYINLGNYPAIKPKEGSISLWVKMEVDIWAGTGHTVNPVILTKNTGGDDFYESYAIYYSPQTKKITGVCSSNNSAEALVSTEKQFALLQWHHLVLTYDYKHVSFYVDGKLERRLMKNFETRFYSKDSVLVGVSANKKNNRWSQISVDDILYYNRVIHADEVLDLYNAPNPDRTNIILNYIWIALAFIAIVTGIFFLIKYRISKTLKKEKERLELTNKLLETELRVNRALMNPHFIFNSLNALHDLILSNEAQNASDYLVKFSKLIRKILESNTSGTISLDMEIEILNKYLEIEALRFDKKINYRIIVNPPIIASAINIPIMMIQPFVENAIWHGLLKKQGEKELLIAFSIIDNKHLQCVIEDNGLGRIKKLVEDSEKKSLATTFIIQRLELMNKINNLNCKLSFEDKALNQGTIVKIILPVLS